MAGALFKRYRWHIFRRRFDELRLSPILDYRQYAQKGDDRTFRFTGGFESVTDGQTLWIRSEDLTVPVSLKHAETYLLPMQKGSSSPKGMSSPSHEGAPSQESVAEGTASSGSPPPSEASSSLEGAIPEVFDPGEETPEKIRWERISALAEGAKVFVGGTLVCRDGRRSFVSTKENPLMVIFYDGPDHSLTARVIRAGRHRGEYWNGLTPYALTIGAIALIIMAVSFLFRPAYRLTVITSVFALFIPLYPILPPGLLFTVMYRRLAWRSRILRAYRDLARLPLRYLAPQKGNRFLSGFATLGKEIPLKENCLLPNGTLYGYVCCNEAPPAAQEGKIPLLLPELSRGKSAGPWYIFGALHPGEDMPVQPQDPFATFGMLPGRPKKIARRCELLAYMLEMTAWLILFTGIGLNIFFLRMLLILL
jgi:hypothetical protein